MACTRITHRRVHIVSVSFRGLHTRMFLVLRRSTSRRRRLFGCMLLYTRRMSHFFMIRLLCGGRCVAAFIMASDLRLCYHLWCDRTKTQFINVYSNSSNSGMAVIYALNLVVAAPRLRDFLPFGWRRTPLVFRSRALVAASRLTLHTLVAAPRLHNGLPFWSRHTQPNSNIAIILRHSLTCWWRPPASIVASHAAGGLPP